MTEVSVVIPTRNRPALLRQTLRSVLWQRDVDLEVVVVDDASTMDLAAAVPELDHPSVRLVRHTAPLGVSTARNRGIEAAAGQWVAFLDDDDLWSPLKLRRQVDAATAQNRIWAVTGAVSVDGSLAVLAGEPPLPAETIIAHLPRYNSVPVGASNVIARADSLAQTGGFDAQLRHMADWDLWIRLGAVGPPATVQEPLVAYRLHRTSATLDTALDAVEPLAELDVIATRYGIRVDRAGVHRWVGWSSLRAGRRRAALGAYLRAVTAGDPKSLARAAVALVHPGAGRDVYYRPVRVDERWRSAAETWLRQLVTVAEAG